MPIFPEVNTYYKGRTHTNLVISEGQAPAEKFIPSALEAVKFQYNYGPEGNQNVVIPKGKIVSLAGMEWDYVSEHMVPALKIANATDIPIGVNHHNVYEHRRDRFSGNQPTVITREYIELPLFNDIGAAAAIKFGAAYDAAPATMLGKFVKSDANGNFVVTSDYNALVLGQVLAVETDLPPAGFLQYFLEMQDNEYKEFLRQQSYAPAPGRTAGSDPMSVEGYPLGTSYLQPANRMKDWTKGIPRLTDGYFRARTQLVDLALTNAAIASVKVTGNTTVTGAGLNVTVATDGAGLVRGAAMMIRLKDNLVNDAIKDGSMANYPEFAGQLPSDVEVKIGGVTVNPNNLHVDYTNNTVVVYFTSAVADQPVLVTVTVLQNQTPGIPTGWDFKGAVGAARILLQR